MPLYRNVLAETLIPFLSVNPIWDDGMSNVPPSLRYFVASLYFISFFNVGFSIILNIQPCFVTFGVYNPKRIVNK